MNSFDRKYDLENTRYWIIKYNLSSDNMYGTSKKVFIDYMNFLCERFREDVPLKRLYDEYLYYLYKLYGSNNKLDIEYFNIACFEKHLRKMYLSVYLAEENYKLVKYVCYDNEGYLRDHLSD